MAQSYGKFIRFISPPLDNYDDMIFQTARVVPNSGVLVKFPLPGSFPVHSYQEQRERIR